MESFLHLLPTVNALLNATSGVLLFIGRRHIKQGRPLQHRKVMLSALSVSALFLATYLVYHFWGYPDNTGSVKYPLQDWTKVVYLSILFPHIVLAALMVPFIIAAVWLALKRNFKAHTRITTRLWPVWMFVSVTGVAVYLMLYVYAGARGGN